MSAQPRPSEYPDEYRPPWHDDEPEPDGKQETEAARQEQRSPRRGLVGTTYLPEAVMVAGPIALAVRDGNPAWLAVSAPIAALWAAREVQARRRSREEER